MCWFSNLFVFCILYRPMFIIIDCYLVLHHKYEINVTFSCCQLTALFVLIWKVLNGKPCTTWFYLQWLNYLEALVWNSQIFLTPTVRSRLLMDWLFKTISLSRWNWRKHKLDEDSKTHSLYCCSSIRCTNLTNEIKRNNYRKHIYISFL